MTSQQYAYPPRVKAGWLYAFLAFQFALQAALVVEPLYPFRLYLRVATFLSSAAFLLLPLGGRPYPIRGLAAAVIAITGLGLLHPQLNTPLAGLAQVALTVAVWAPVFWVTRVRITPDVLRTVILMVWAFNTASAGLGVLQIYDPARFAPDPRMSRELLGEISEGLLVTLDDGRKVFRPTGLSDIPGGAATAGMYAVLTGFGVAATARNPLLRLATGPAAAVGMFCIYLCQMRLALVVTLIGLAGLGALMAARGRLGRAAWFLAVAAVAVVGGFVWASQVGSEAVAARVATLTERSAGEVYYSNRGVFLEETVTELLPQYPLGAGLGRWGMMHAYFGTKANPDSPPLWAEIQPTGWVFDGGLPLLLAGYAALLGACWVTYRASLRVPAAAADLITVILALNIGVVAITFAAHVFVAQTGILFWVLNAAAFAAANPAAPPVTPPRLARR